MSNQVIRKAFESRLKTYATAQGLSIAYEGVAFSPPATTYLRSFVLPANTNSDTLDGVHRGYQGVYQVSIVCPINTSSATIDAIVAALDALYPVTFTQDGARITMTRPMGKRPAIQEPDRYVVPVDGAYRLDTV